MNTSFTRNIFKPYSPIISNYKTNMMSKNDLKFNSFCSFVRTRTMAKYSKRMDGRSEIVSLKAKLRFRFKIDSPIKWTKNTPIKSWPNIRILLIVLLRIFLFILFDSIKQIEAQLSPVSGFLVHEKARSPKTLVW